MPHDDTPSWIRELYQDIHPNILNYSQGRRIPWGPRPGATGPMVNAFQRRQNVRQPTNYVEPFTEPFPNPANDMPPWQTTVTPAPPTNERNPNINRNPMVFGDRGINPGNINTNPLDANPGANIPPPTSNNVVSNLPPPRTLNNDTFSLPNIQSPFDLIFGAMRGIGENTPALANIRQRNLERRAQRRPYTFTSGSGDLSSNTDVYNPLSINDLLDALRGGREPNDPRRN